MTLAPFPDETIQFAKDALSTINSCVELFVEARDAGRIKFDDDMVVRGLELISTMLLRAARIPEETRNRKFRHWVEHGPQLCNELIEKVSEREDKILKLDDVTAFLEKESDGYVVKLERAQPTAKAR
jgi:hypothetical protein